MSVVRQMIRKLVNRVLARYGPWRAAQTGLALLIVCLALLLLFELVIPVQPGRDMGDVAIDQSIMASRVVPELPEPNSADLREIAKVFRAGLFKSTAPLGDRPLADRTIERIRSQLSLKSILPINGEPVAYIHIKGMGLKDCRIGDSVSDLFTVLNIGERNVEISIVGHKVVLSY
jgi:hypothetical protein